MKIAKDKNRIKNDIYDSTYHLHNHWNDHIATGLEHLFYRNMDKGCKSQSNDNHAILLTIIKNGLFRCE